MSGFPGCPRAGRSIPLAGTAAMRSRPGTASSAGVKKRPMAGWIRSNGKELAVTTLPLICRDLVSANG